MIHFFTNILQNFQIFILIKKKEIKKEYLK